MNQEKLNKKFIQDKKWYLTSYNKDDLPAIGLFFKELYMGHSDYGNMGFFHWKIIDNYVQPGIINLIKDKNRIASTTSITPKLLVYKGEVVNAAEIGDTYTHPDYWRQGMFTLLINQTREDAEKYGINFVYGTPNELSLPGYQKKANFDIVKNLHLRSLVFPVNIRFSIEKKSHWIIGSVFGSIFSVLSFLVYKIKNIFFFIDKLIVVEEIDQIPKDWNDLWNYAKQGYDFIINRNKEATVWRFLDNPNKYKMVILRKNKILIGYIVYRTIQSERGIHVTIADFLTRPGEENSLYIGINHIIEHSYKIGADNISLWCVRNSPYYNIFKKKGFFTRGNVPVICYQNEFAKSVENCQSWHFTISDSDNI